MLGITRRSASMWPSLHRLQGIISARNDPVPEPFSSFWNPRGVNLCTRWKQTSSTADINFTVSILGPPNAGKSTLFNRLQCKERNKTYRLGSHKKKARGRIGSKRSPAAMPLCRQSLEQRGIDEHAGVELEELSSS